MSTASASAAVPADDIAGESRLRSLAAAVLPAASVPAILGLILLLLFLPLYMHPALDAAGSAAILGVSREAAHELSDQTVRELYLGPGTFAFAGPDGERFYGAEEAAHLRDVRLVLFGFLALAGASLALLVGALARGWQDAWVWRSIARGAVALVVGLAALGAFALLAFELAFELFHRLFFPAGNWAFDPASQRLVQLYPLAFWQLTAGVLGGLGLAAGAGVWLVARRRAGSLEQRHEHAGTAGRSAQ